MKLSLTEEWFAKETLAEDTRDVAAGLARADAPVAHDQAVPPRREDQIPERVGVTRPPGQKSVRPAK
jgi:hypothetical protein